MSVEFNTIDGTNHKIKDVDLVDYLEDLKSFKIVKSSHPSLFKIVDCDIVKFIDCDISGVVYVNNAIEYKTKCNVKYENIEQNLMKFIRTYMTYDRSYISFCDKNSIYLLLINLNIDVISIINSIIEIGYKLINIRIDLFSLMFNFHDDFIKYLSDRGFTKSEEIDSEMRAMFIKDFNELNVCSKSITSYLCKKVTSPNYQGVITRYMDYMNIEISSYKFR